MFRPSARARYALRAMIEISLHEGTRLLLLREIAQAQGISPRYLEQLAVPLRRQGLLDAVRGPHGGYRLARPACQITARQVIEAVEGSLDLLDCVSDPTACERTAACAARGLWTRVSEAITTVLSKTTLADLRGEQQAADTASAAAYHI